MADPVSNGEPVLFAAQISGDETLSQAAARMLDFLLYKAPRTRDGIIYHNYFENMPWVDAIYMAPLSRVAKTIVHFPLGRIAPTPGISPAAATTGFQR